MGSWRRAGRAAARSLAAIILALLSVLYAGCGKTQAPAVPLGERISNAGEVILAIRGGLKRHARSITVRFSYGSDIFSELSAVIDDWVEAALAETDDPAEGDYLRYQTGGYTWTCGYTAGEGYHYTVVITPSYYCYLTQEEMAANAAAELLAGLDLDRGAPDAEKIYRVYDWLCANVRYDKVHSRHPYNHLRSTAYGALVLRCAACQGFCVALYRLLRELGISCRIITGRAGGDTLHAWVIAEVDGQWYGLDPTWDAGRASGTESPEQSGTARSASEGAGYRYFLAGAEEFSDHVPGEAFLTEDFLGAHPMAPSAYIYSEG